MTLKNLLLLYLKSNKANYKELRGYLSGNYTAPDSSANINEQSVRTVLYRLKKQGLIENRQGTWIITKHGEKYTTNHNQPLKFFEKTIAYKTSRRILCMFDIPEHERYKRDWLRKQLEILDFTLLQQSVWIGPAPLPQEFLAYTKEIAVLPYIKFLEVTNRDII
jgi:DNA-binding transcriptional regulator PaaX